MAEVGELWRKNEGRERLTAHVAIDGAGTCAVPGSLAAPHGDDALDLGLHARACGLPIETCHQ